MRGRDDGVLDLNKVDVLVCVGWVWSEVLLMIGMDKIVLSVLLSVEEEYYVSCWEIDRVGVNVWGFFSFIVEIVFARRLFENGGVFIVWSDVLCGFSKKDCFWF